MKARIIDGYMYGGLYDEVFLTNNPALAAIWELTDILPGPGKMYRPEWDGEKWFEAASPAEIIEYLQPEVDIIKRDYDLLLEDLCRKPIRHFIMEDIPIPVEVKTEYDRLVDECNTLIQAIIPTETYSRPGKTPKGK